MLTFRMDVAWRILKIALNQWFEHRSSRLGAALAYYSVFSMGPLLLIVTSVAGLFFDADTVRSGLSSQFKALLGSAGSQAVEALLLGASSARSGRLAGLAGVVLLVVTALGVVSQLKDAINTIWNVSEPKDVKVSWYVRTYLVSFAGILALGFLLAVSLVISTVLSALSAHLGTSTTIVGVLLNTLVSLALLSVVFAMLFKWFPDTEVSWHDVLPGAFATAVLFNFGKFVIGWYIGREGLESTYGATASLVALLIWVYYSAQIVLFGAELTHACATAIGSRRDRSAKETLPNTAPRADAPSAT
jgi:membrane protein